MGPAEAVKTKQSTTNIWRIKHDLPLKSIHLKPFCCNLFSVHRTKMYRDKRHSLAELFGASTFREAVHDFHFCFLCGLDCNLFDYEVLVFPVMAIVDR